MTLIGLSTASVYPESTAHAFALRRVARLRRGRGDGRHRRAQPADGGGQAALRPPRDARSAPCTRPACSSPSGSGAPSPWGKLERSAEMAHAVGADVVVVHPPFRWQKDYAARASSTGSRRSRSRPASPSRSRTCTRGGPPARRGMEMYLPGWDPSDENYANTTIDLSHAAIAQLRRRSRWPTGSATGCATSTSPTAPARPRTSTWCRAAARWAPPASCATSPARASTATSCSRSTPARRRPGGARGRPARVAGVRPRALRGAHAMSTRAAAARPPTRGARHPGAILAAARTSFADKGFAGTTIRGVAATAGVDAALVHHYFGTKDDLFLAALELPGRPAPGASRRLSRAGSTAPASGCCARSCRCGTTPRSPRLAARVRPLGARAGRRAAAHARASCRWCFVPVGEALELDRPEVRMPLRRIQLIGLAGPLRAAVDPVTSLRLEPIASMPRPAAYLWVAAVRPGRSSDYLTRPADLPPSTCGRLLTRGGGPPGDIIQHMMKNAVEIRGLTVVRGTRAVLDAPRPHHRAGQRDRAARAERLRQDHADALPGRRPADDRRQRARSPASRPAASSCGTGSATSPRRRACTTTSPSARTSRFFARVLGVDAASVDRAIERGRPRRPHRPGGRAAQRRPALPGQPGRRPARQPRPAGARRADGRSRPGAAPRPLGALPPARRRRRRGVRLQPRDGRGRALRPAAADARGPDHRRRHSRPDPASRPAPPTSRAPSWPWSTPPPRGARDDPADPARRGRPGAHPAPPRPSYRWPCCWCCRALLITLLWWMFEDQPGDLFDRFGPALLAMFPFIVMFLVTSVTTLRERQLGHPRAAARDADGQARLPRRLRPRLRRGRGRAGGARGEPQRRAARPRRRGPGLAARSWSRSPTPCSARRSGCSSARSRRPSSRPCSSCRCS